MIGFKSKAIDSYDRLDDYARNTSRANLALVIAVVALVIMTMRKETISVTVPSDFSNPIVVQGNQANKEFKVQWAYSIAAILGNINEKNATFVIERIRKIIPPELNPVAVEKELAAEVEGLRLRGVRQEFTITDVIYSSVADVVWVFGDKTTTSLRSGAQDTTNWTFEMRIGIRAGLPKVLDIQQYAGVPNPSKREREILLENNPRATLSGEAQIIEITRPVDRGVQG